MIRATSELIEMKSRPNLQTGLLKSDADVSKTPLGLVATREDLVQ